MIMMLNLFRILDRRYWVPPVGPPPLAPVPGPPPQQSQPATVQRTNSFNSAITNRMSDLSLNGGQGSRLSLGRKDKKNKDEEKGDADSIGRKKGLFKMMKR